MTTQPPRSLAFSFALFSALLFVPACSDSSSNTGSTTPTFDADTSYLDDLETVQEETEEEIANDGTEFDTLIEESTPEPSAQSQVAEKPAKEYKDEVRRWVPDSGSKSLLGRSRDRARSVGTQMQDSTQPENGLALTQFDEEYAQAAGYAWDMPEDWRMAVPGTGRFAEMYITHQLGNASVAFTKESNSPSQIKRTLESYFTDRPHTKSTTGTVMDFSITYFDLSGTYSDSTYTGTRNESPFFAIHAAVIELPTTNVLIRLWGPQRTVEQSTGMLDSMIREMYEKEP